jgi:protein-S-isoprenylcysteine O-methyltransferase Ste14
VRPIGALLFFLSLVYFLFAYLITFGEVVEGSIEASALTWNGVLFTIFALHHSLFARTGARNLILRVVPAELERSVYVWIASILFLIVCMLWRPVPGVAWRVEGALLWPLRLIQLFGIWLTLRSAALLDVRELAGLKPASVAVFRTTGPYGWVRHPIYTGWFLLVWSAAPMTMTRLEFAVISCAYLLIAIPFEECSMRAIPGGAYERYMAVVRWRLVPRIY